MEQVRTVPICLYDGTFVGGEKQEKEQQSRKEEKKSFDVSSSRQYEQNSSSISKKCSTEKTFVPIKIHVENKIDESSSEKMKVPEKNQLYVEEKTDLVPGGNRKTTTIVTTSQCKSNSSITNHVPEWKSFSTFPRHHSLDRHGKENVLSKGTVPRGSGSTKEKAAENKIEIKLSGPPDDANEEETNVKKKKEALSSKFNNSTSSIPSLVKIEVPSNLGGATSCPNGLHEKPKTLNEINSKLLEAQRQLSGQLEDLEERKTGKLPDNEKEKKIGTVQINNAPPIKEHREKDSLTYQTPRSLSPEKPKPLSSPQLERYMEVWDNISKDINEIKNKPEKQPNSPQEDEVPSQGTMETLGEHSPTEYPASEDRNIPDMPDRLRICPKQPSAVKKDEYNTDRGEDDKQEECDSDTQSEDKLCGEAETLEENDSADLGTDYACYACDACTQTDPVVIVDRDKSCVVM